MTAENVVPHGEITELTSRAACKAALRGQPMSSNPDGTSKPANLLFMDGAEHERLRAVIRRVVARLEPLPEALADRIRALVGNLRPRLEFDLVTDFARPVAAAVAAEVVGTAKVDEPEVLDELESITTNLDDVWAATVDNATGAAALRTALVLSRAEPIPGGGLEILREAHAAGQILRQEAMISPVMLAHASYENSMNFLGLAALRVVTDADLAAALRDPAHNATSTIRRLAAEISPARLVMRRATDTVELPGITVRAQRKLAVRLWSETEPGWAFGLGPHACPGARVAVAEAEVALRALADDLHGNEVLRDVTWKSHPAFHGLTRALVVRG